MALLNGTTGPDYFGLQLTVTPNPPGLPEKMNPDQTSRFLVPNTMLKIVLLDPGVQYTLTMNYEKRDEADARGRKVSLHSITTYSTNP
jgi:hypothetical protein